MLYLVFSVFFFSFPEHTVLYKGNYTVQKRVTSSSQVDIQLVQRAPIRFIIRQNKTRCSQCAQMTLRMNDTQFVKVATLELHGMFSSVNHTSFFFVGILDKLKSSIDLSAIIRDVMKKNNMTEPTDHEFLRQKIFKDYENTSVSYCVAFNVTEHSTQANSTFLADNRADGSIYIANKANDYIINFTSYQFDEYKYISEGKIFGVIASVGIFISFIAWNYIIKAFDSHVRLMQLSVHSFVMHVAFEFNYGVFFFNLADTNSHLTFLYTVLFSLIMILYFSFETRQLSEVWKSSLGDLELAMQHPIFLDFFLEITIALFVYSTAINYVFTAPYVCLTLMYSFFLPQIFHSTQTASRKSRDMFFNLSVSIVRLLPVFYFTCYRDNIMESYCPAVMIYTTVYLMLQNFVIFLQNIFGGSFFMPKKMRPVPFNYADGEVDPGTECPICLSPIEAEERTMVTPCRHAFHKECLERWMDERLVCPVCRARLPEGEESRGDRNQTQEERAPRDVDTLI